jgi:hypothetical protein
VALVDEVAGGYRFGELHATIGNFALPTSTQLSSALAARGLRGTASLSWAWDDQEPVPPFLPFLTGVDASGSRSFVTPSGVVPQIDVVQGLTPAAN